MNEITGQYSCKRNYKGLKCDECNIGYFDFLNGCKGKIINSLIISKEFSILGLSERIFEESMEGSIPNLNQVNHGN